MKNKRTKKKAARRLRVEQLELRRMLAGVVINEIHFDPDDTTEQVEFIELYNDSTEAVDLSEWVLDDAVDFTFPAGASIAANGYFVITQDMAEFQTKFGVAADGQWQLGDRLSNEGENIELRNALGQTVDEVNYQLGFPWPTVGENGGSIELIHPSLDNNLAGSWRISAGDSGLPDTPVTLLAGQDTNWRYRKGTSEASNPIDAWRFSDFVEDGSWQTGQTSIGYGDGDDNTFVNDMRNSYTSLYLRNTFTITGAVPNTILLRVYVDDGAAVWINGNRVGLFHVEDTELAYNDLAFNHDANGFEELYLQGANQYLNSGENTIAIHVLNSSINSSDLSIDAEVIIPAAGAAEAKPTPGAVNSVFNANAAPQLRQLDQSVKQPISGEDVVISIKATDPDGVQGLTLDYQLVDPGNYIRITDAAYDTNWTTVVMHDDGLNGDAVAGDDVYSVTLPGSLQTHRRLVRYRITATDTLGASITGPYADDPQPNFAYFVYDGVPDYTGSMRPGFQPNVTYSGDVLDNMATYHLIANSQDVNNSQYNGSFNLVQFRGTLVYDGVVYDHIEFRNRGRASTYAVGKNKWKLNFLRGHSFRARDNYGKRYDRDWDKINILPGTNPWWRNDVSTEGTVLYEPAAFKLYELAGTPSSNTQYFQFRVIDSASEAVVGDQYAGDFWGLYIGIEQPDGRFLDEHDLPDGNIFNMHGGAFGATSQRNQGSELPTNRSDLQAFLSGIDGGFESLQWWEDNLNFDSYFAWNLINHAVNNSDIRPNENVNYYHNQENGQWYTLPWDLDLTFEDAPHWNNPVTNREQIRSVLSQHPSVLLAFENRVREIQDLLLDNEDAARVVEELANILTQDSNDLTIIESNQAQWDYHPQKRKKGIWYDNFNPSLLPSQTFDGLVTYMQDFLSPGGYGYNLVDGQGDDSNIPNQPTITFVGTPGYARDGLVFQTSNFSDPQGAGTFDAIEWRVAEVHNSSVANYDPTKSYIYEIEGTWESGELTTFDSQLTIPQVAVEPGKTYRARVRMRDSSGHWSHWSDADEFQVSAAVNPVVGSVVISEINYNPGDPTATELASGFVDKDEFEFIELVNVGTSTVSLADIKFEQTDGGSEGISFDFSTGAITSLAPNERILVVENLAGFEARYGTNLPVAGVWSGGLSNNGETLTMTVDGTIFHQFEYDDAWYPSTDNGGYTLQIIDSSNPDLSSWGLQESWRPSGLFGGTPGEVDSGPSADFDGDNDVDGADFLAWQRGFSTAGTATPQDGDSNRDGTVDVSDFNVWNSQLGSTSALAAAVASAEPTSRLDEANATVAGFSEFVSVAALYAESVPTDLDPSDAYDSAYESYVANDANSTSDELSELTMSSSQSSTDEAFSTFDSDEEPNDYLELESAFIDLV